VIIFRVNKFEYRAKIKSMKLNEGSDRKLAINVLKLLMKKKNVIANLHILNYSLHLI